MQVYKTTVVNITLENEEIELFESILTVITKKKIGFNKLLDLDQLDLLSHIAESLKQDIK